MFFFELSNHLIELGQNINIGTVFYKEVNISFPPEI